MRPCVLFSFFLLAWTPWGWASTPQARAVERAYQQVMNNYFDHIQRQVGSAKSMNEFVNKSLIQMTPSQAEKKILEKSKVPTPRVIRVKNGIRFEYEDGVSLEVQFGKNIGDLQVKEVGRIEAQRLDWSLVPRAEAVVGLAVRGAIAIYRMFVGPSLKVTAAAAAAGAVGGCYLGSASKYEYESIPDSCFDGAVAGATILSGLSAIPELSEKVKPSAKVKSFLKVFGLLGTVAAVGFQAEALITMNGSITRCTSAQGDFVVHAKSAGATKEELYSIFDQKIQFQKSGHPAEVVSLNEQDLVEYLSRQSHFADVPRDQLRLAVQHMMQEVTERQKVCRQKGIGHTESHTVGKAQGISHGVSRGAEGQAQ